ncbi:unnamed protein product [Toxocara canis]|uniref:Protocadherin Fat 4 n=1 Tax=Toxocara canis TaxID=6265 RepID=A0A183TXL0_TOXCA|nr:unnamed protein product [Toxocara canis]
MSLSFCSKQCLHGKCIFTVGDSFCKCEKGFEGPLCDQAISLRDPCQFYNCNLGKCESKDGVAACICPEGVVGEFCENHDACASRPCLNEGQCVPVSTNASLFVCVCQQGFSGERCEVDESHADCNAMCSVGDICHIVNGEQSVSSCDECVNSVRCVQYGERNVTCICDSAWDGARCDSPFKACEKVACAPYEMCRAERNKVGAKAECRCAPGLAGANCSTTTAATFKASSFFLHQSSTLMIGSSLAPYSLMFSFRTSLRNTHIVTAENILNQMQFIVELRDGFLYVNFSTTTAFFPLVPFELSDDRWYSVAIKNLRKRISLEVYMDDFLVRNTVVDEKRNMGIFWTRFGKDRDVNFRGCIRDVRINDEPVDLKNSRRSIGIREGCHREKHCTPNPCENGGKCIDEWDAFTCTCVRPFLPPHCLKKLSEVTLGHGNISSRIEFSVGNDSELVKLNTDLSLLMRTNKPNGALLYIGEKEHETETIGTFISLAVVNGSLQAKSSLGKKRVFSAISMQPISDNAVHLLRLVRNANNITVFVDGAKWMNFEVKNRFDHPLLADLLVIGNADGLRKEAFDTDDYFKGTVQDLRINGYSAALTPFPPDVNIQQFGSRTSEKNVIEGTVSDDVCGERDRCENGKCVNIFNDFECICDFSWMGHTCNRKDHCAFTACPKNVHCTNFEAGYICNSSLPATFVMSSSVIYFLEGSVTERSLRAGNLSLSLRTRSMFGQILYFESEGNSLNISLKYGEPVLDVSFQGQSTRANVTSAVNDGQWHTLKLNDKVIWVDDAPERVNANSLHIEALLAQTNATLVIGRRDTSSPSFDGCLKDVQIGPFAPLSFFEGNKSGGLVDESLRFVLSKRTNLRDDCHSEELCGVYDPCKNSATCRDLWNLRKCECPTGFSGDLCEENINECKWHKCVHGECVDGIGEFRCACLPGYTGQYCEQKIEYCHPSRCLNGGSCIALNSSASCTCATGFFGARCQQKVSLHLI